MSPLDRTYHLEVRESPRSVNDDHSAERAHRHVAAREKKRWEGLWLQQFLVARMQKHMSYCAVNIAIYFKHRNHRDTENFRHPVVKPLADALQKGGYLPDDTEEWFKVIDFRLVEGTEHWPEHMPPMVKAVTVVELEAQYQ